MHSPEFASTLLDLTQDKLVVIDDAGTYRYANAATERMLGYDNDEFIGTNALEYIHSADRAEVRSIFERLVEADEELTETAQFRHRAADGSWVWLESRMWNRSDDDLGGYVVSSRDITASKELERRQRETEIRLRELASNTEDVLWMFSADWNELLFVNEAFEDVWGMSKAELTDDATRFLDGVHPDDRSRVRRAMDRLSAGEPVELEYRVNPERSYRRWVWVKGRPIVEDGTVSRIVGFARDVTDRRRRERQLQVLGTLLRHNLRNVMNVIVGNADLASTRGNETVEQHMKTIVDVGTELLTTVEKERQIVEVLLDPGERTTVDLSTLVSVLVDDIRADYPEATITADLPETAPVVAVSEIRRAIEELLENAVEHAPSPPTVDIRLRTHATSVTLKIEDDGQPIPANEIEPLFSGAELSDVYHGTGLGLWLVYWIVDLSDGELGFGRTNDDNGNVVTVKLPRASV